MLWGVATASPQSLSTVLGDQWGAAVPVVSVLALAMPFALVAHFAGILCDATNHLNVKIVIRSSQIALVLALFAALSRFGIVGVAAAYALGQIAVAVALFFVVSRILDRRARAASSVRAGCQCLTAAVLIGAADLAGTRAGAPPSVTLLIQIALGLTVVAFWMLKAQRGTAWRETRLRLLGSRTDTVEGRYSPLVRWLDARAGRDPAAVNTAGQGPS